MSELYYVAGLPRSGATMMINILKQNPKIHGEAVSSLCSIFSSVHYNWEKLEPNREYRNDAARYDVLKGILYNYHASHNREIVFDKDRMWVSRIAILEALLQKQVKILCPVRNPAEILSSFEKIRRNNPLTVTMTDDIQAESSTIASRAYHFAGPNGPMGLAHACIRDAVTMGYLDRMLFIDYNRFCNSPRSQLKRIYDFFELPSFDHDLENIEQKEVYDDTIQKLPNLHKIKPRLEKTTVNCVDYLGLDLYQQYNREIFWDAWI
jgi:hypothetical protein